MPTFKISGVWKDGNNVITHYAFHTVNNNGTVTRQMKIAKAQAIVLLETPGNNATTWLWNYSAAHWMNGEAVQVVNGPFGKYLRSVHDKQMKDNLLHLIDYGWIVA